MTPEPHASQTTLAWDGGTVKAAWHRPPPSAEAVLVLAHGAGGDMEHPLLAQIACGLAERGIAVLRFNFPYAEAGRRAPDRAPLLESCYRAAAETASHVARHLFLGGKSLGGRIASHVVAEGFPASGLVFFGYPLHPPGKPERIRDAHLAQVEVPMLFLQGTRDAFASRDLLHKTLESLPSAVLVELEGGDHSFVVPGRQRDDVVEELVRATASFVSAQTSR